MAKFLVKIIFRTLLKHRFSTLLTMGGLTAGLFACYAITIYTFHQLSFDDFHGDANRIYRLLSSTKDRVAAIVPYTWGQAMKDEIAAIEEVVSFQNITIGLTVKQGDRYFSQHGFIGVDSSFLEVFDFPVIKGGGGRHFLHDPTKMLLTHEMAVKYFGDQDPIGKMLAVNLWGTFVTFEVQGLVDCPVNSHIQFKFLLPIESVKRHFFSQTAFSSWTTHFAHTYFLLADGFDRGRLEEDMQAVLERHGGKQAMEKYAPDIQSLEDIYLKSDVKFDFQPRGDIQHLIILLVVGLGILAMAMINFVNLTVARSISSIRQTVLSRILGASNRAVFFQFFMESTFILVICSGIAMALLMLLLPAINSVGGTSIDMVQFATLQHCLLPIGISLLLSVGVSLYSVAFLSSFKPTVVISSKSGDGLKNREQQRMLVIVQSALSITLIIATTTIFEQVKFMTNKDLGFEKEQIVTIDGSSVVAADKQKMQLLKEAALKHPGITFITSSSSYPGDMGGHSSQYYHPQGWPMGESTPIWTFYTDHDFTKTFGLEVVAGRELDRTFSSDSSAVIINEAAMDYFAVQDSSWHTDPVGKVLDHSGKTSTVVGMVKNFHFEPLNQAINPLVIQVDPSSAFSVQVRLASSGFAESLGHLARIWKEQFPSVPFGYRFLDDEFEQYMETDRKLAALLRAFTILSVVIAILGLTGLATFVTLQRSKEMSIRKVIGASESEVIWLISSYFLRLVLISNLVAIPVGYVLMVEWLDGFAFRTEISPLFFVQAMILSVLIVIFSVGLEARRLVYQNPAEILRKD